MVKAKALRPKFRILNKCYKLIQPSQKNRSKTQRAGGYTQNGTFSEFCILSRHLDRFCSSKRPRGPRGPPELPNDKKTAAPRLLDRLLFRYPPPQIRLKWDVLSVTFNGKFQRLNRFFDAWLPNDFERSSPWLSKSSLFFEIHEDGEVWRTAEVILPFFRKWRLVRICQCLILGVVSFWVYPPVGIISFFFAFASQLYVSWLWAT